MYTNEFVEKTKNILIKYDPTCLAIKGFNVNDTIVEDCVLIIGLNPAGSKDEAIKEMNSNYLDFYYIPGLSRKEFEFHYPKYYSSIYKFCEEILGNVKWSWFNTFNSKLNINNINDKIINKIKSFYEDNKSANTTIYVGDILYYHETNSKKLSINKSNWNTYCNEMLQMHIVELKKRNKNIKFVYINNSDVSHGICGEDRVTMKIIDDVPVFFGTMLSGGHLDNFSRDRLINEIKLYINKER